MPWIKSPHAETLSVHTRKELLAQIIARGESIGKKKGGYAALVLEWWYKQGCPPVSEADAAVQTVKAKKSA